MKYAIILAIVGLLIITACSKQALQDTTTTNELTDNDITELNQALDAADTVDNQLDTTDFDSFTSDLDLLDSTTSD